MKKFKFLALTVAGAMMFAACGNSDAETEEEIIEDDIMEEVSEYADEVEETVEEMVEEESAQASADWDEVLDEYEEFVDEYVKFAKKAQNGDMSAMASYASCLEKATSLSEKLDAAGDDLSARQMARYQKITLKMTKAAM